MLCAYALRPQSCPCVLRKVNPHVLLQVVWSLYLRMLWYVLCATIFFLWSAEGFFEGWLYRASNRNEAL